MKKPALARSLELAAAKIFKRTRGVQFRFDHQFEQVELMQVTYGGVAVIDDFKKWGAEQDQDIRYPLSEYLKVVDERLGHTQKQDAPDPNMTRLLAVVYEYTGDLPSQAVVRKLLEKWTIDDLIAGFNEFASGLDEKQMKTAIRKFFIDGGADIVIEALLKHGRFDLNERK